MCTVTEASPGRAFAFDVRSTTIPVAHWRYEIVAADGGCHVTESTWDRRPGWFRKIARYATGVHDRTAANGDHIRADARPVEGARRVAVRAGSPRFQPRS